MTGIIERYDDRRGFGFIKPMYGAGWHTPCVFFHVSCVKHPEDGVPVGATVKFKVVEGVKGPQCVGVELVKAKLSPPTAQPRKAA